MTELERLPYVKRMVDRHGVHRFYFNRPSCPATALPGPEGGHEFMIAYARALEDGTGAAQAPPPRRHAYDSDELRHLTPGSFSELVARYYRSPNFLPLAPVTKATYQNELENLRAAYGHLPVAALDRKGVKLILSGKADRPGAYNKTLRMLRMLMGFAIEEEDRTDDPTARIKKLKVNGGRGFIAWTEDDIDQFEDCHAVGSRARLAIGLLLYTAQRRGDVVGLGRGNVRGNFINLTQRKTGAYLEIPIHDDLAAILRLAPVGPATFLINQFDAAFSPEGFGNWFGDCCREAGMPVGYNAHGLRKASLRRLSEAGCTTPQIMAISGHKSIEEVERYTRGANQPLLAAEAMRRLPSRSTRLSTRLVSS